MSQKQQSILPTTTPQDKLSVHSADDHDNNANSLQNAPPYKRQLKTWDDVRQEWRSGSRMRVVKYYFLWFAIGAVIGAVIGVIIGLIFRYT